MGLDSDGFRLVWFGLVRFGSIRFASGWLGLGGEGRGPLWGGDPQQGEGGQAAWLAMPRRVGGWWSTNSLKMGIPYLALPGVRQADGP